MTPRTARKIALRVLVFAVLVWIGAALAGCNSNLEVKQDAQGGWEFRCSSPHSVQLCADAVENLNAKLREGERQ